MTESTEAGNRNIVAFVQWFIVAVLAITILALAAVHAPPRIRLLGLFPIACGLVAGIGLGRLATSLGIGDSLPLVLASFVLIAAGQVGAMVEAHRQWTAKEWELFEKSPTGQLALKEADSEQVPADFKASLQESIQRQRDELKFRNYLTRRVSPLGTWQEPWPFVFWLTEIALASASGCWAFRRQFLPAKDA